MLTRYYNSVRTPMFDIFDALRLFDDSSVESELRSRTDSIDEAGIKIELPGVKASDIDVTVEGKKLKISGKSRHGKEFLYSYVIKSNVDDSSISAKFQDGLLEIVLPKKHDVTSSRKISVSS